MAEPSRTERVFAQDYQTDDENFPTGNADPVTEAELDDLLYGEGDPHERMARLLELRNELVGRQSSEFTDDDANELLADVDRAILRLRGDRGSPAELGDFEGEETDHRETLSPDSDEYIDMVEREEAEQAQTDAALGDGFDADDEESR
jgi:hypothetical protein